MVVIRDVFRGVSSVKWRGFLCLVYSVICALLG